jgi:hypothetical protein
MSRDGYTWLGRHPMIGLPVCLLMLPMYVLVYCLEAFGQGYREWRSDLRDLSRRIRRI